jgi:hypothetical protein
VDITCGFFPFLPDGPDTPITSPPESHFRPGDNLRLFCHTASNSPVRYSWLFNGRPQSSTQELFIPNVIANNAGSYTCLVHNSATGVSRTTVKNIVNGSLQHKHQVLGWCHVFSGRAERSSPQPVRTDPGKSQSSPEPPAPSLSLPIILLLSF